MSENKSGLVPIVVEEFDDMGFDGGCEGDPSPPPCPDEGAFWAHAAVAAKRTIARAHAALREFLHTADNRERSGQVFRCLANPMPAAISGRVAIATTVTRW
jgi:hypothetical protein